MFIQGGSTPRSNHFPFYIPFFHEKGTPSVYPLLTKGTPLTYLVENFTSPLTAVNALSFK